MKRIIASVIVLFIALAAGGSALDRAPEPAPELPQQTAPAEESIEVTAPTESVEADPSASLRRSRRKVLMPRRNRKRRAQSPRASLT